MTSRLADALAFVGVQVWEGVDPPSDRRKHEWRAARLKQLFGDSDDMMLFSIEKAIAEKCGHLKNSLLEHANRTQLENELSAVVKKINKYIEKVRQIKEGMSRTSPSDFIDYAARKDPMDEGRNLYDSAVQSSKSQGSSAILHEKESCNRFIAN